MQWDLERHRAAFPHSAVWEHEGRLYGWWFQGNNYRRTHGFYGEYPPSYTRRVFTLVPPTFAANTLHLFSGSVPIGSGLRFDISSKFNPDVIGDAENLSEHLVDCHFELVLADPPYSAADAVIYGVKMPRTWKVFQELHKVVVPGGLVVWLCTRPPLYLTRQWDLVGIVGFHVGTNRLVRSVLFLERKP
jgi:hypothetical protein